MGLTPPWTMLKKMRYWRSMASLTAVCSASQKKKDYNLIAISAREFSALGMPKSELKASADKKFTKYWVNLGFWQFSFWIEHQKVINYGSYESYYDNSIDYWCFSDIYDGLTMRVIMQGLGLVILCLAGGGIRLNEDDDENIIFLMVSWQEVEQGWRMTLMMLMIMIMLIMISWQGTGGTMLNDDDEVDDYRNELIIFMWSKGVTR